MPTWKSGCRRSPGAVTVPEEAVLHSGERAVVIVEKAKGLFEPRDVELGALGDGYTGDPQGRACRRNRGHFLAVPDRFGKQSQGGHPEDAGGAEPRAQPCRKLIAAPTGTPALGKMFAKIIQWSIQQ